MDFMETSKLSPKTQSPQLTASTSMETNSMRDDNQDIDFNKSTKKLEKNCQKDQHDQRRERREGTNRVY